MAILLSFNWKQYIFKNVRSISLHFRFWYQLQRTKPSFSGQRTIRKRAIIRCSSWHEVGRLRVVAVQQALPYNWDGDLDMPDIWFHSQEGHINSNNFSDQRNGVLQNSQNSLILLRDSASMHADWTWLSVST